MPCAPRHRWIALKAGCTNRLRRSFREWANCLRMAAAARSAGVAVWSKGIPRPECNSGPAPTSHASSTGRGGRHVFFFHHSLCARVVAAMPGINGWHDTAGRQHAAETPLRMQRHFPALCEETRNRFLARENAEKKKCKHTETERGAVRRKELSFRFALRFFLVWACDVLPRCVPPVQINFL